MDTENVSTVVCDQCGESSHESNVQAVPWGELFCSRCVSDYLFWCDGCSELAHRDDWHDVDGDAFCDGCTDRYAYWCDSCERYHSDSHECEYRDLRGLEDYSYKPHPVFHGVSARHLHFGVELEMESTAGNGQDVLNYFQQDFTMDDFYYKSDGSIMSSDGFEMVSHPRTMESWQSLLPRLQDAMRYARRYGMRSWNTETCGIHVHVDARTFESNAHLLRFAMLIRRNERDLSRLAGRGSVGYASYDMGRIAQTVKDRKTYGGAGDRYLVVNMQNRSTIEVRMFRGSLNPERLVADVELVHALVEYTRSQTARSWMRFGDRFDVFASWVMDHEEYSHLHTLITKSFDMAAA